MVVRLLVLLAALTSFTASASQPQSDEHRVWIAVAKLVLANESAGRKQVVSLPVFHRTSFPKLELSITQLLESAKKDFCGATPDSAEEVIVELKKLSVSELPTREAFAGHPEFEIVDKRPSQGDYLGLSRVLFSADGLIAFLNADVGGESGSIVMMRLENGEWTKLEECARWTSS